MPWGGPGLELWLLRIESKAAQTLGGSSDPGAASPRPAQAPPCNLDPLALGSQPHPPRLLCDLGGPSSLSVPPRTRL